MDSKVPYYLKMLRIGDWIKFYMAFSLAGALLAGATPLQIIFVFLIYFVIIGYAFAVNNYFDVDIDKLHSGKIKSNKNPLASGLVSIKGVELMMLFQVGIAMLSFLMSYFGLFIVILNILLLTVYSGIFRLKEKFIIDIITHGLMFGAVPFLAGFALCRDYLLSNLLLISLLPFILAAEALIAHQIVEYDEDLLSTKTTITVIGKRNGLLLMEAAAAISIGLLIIINRIEPLPFWALIVLGSYLLAYPAYSCRSLIHDFRHIASPQ